MKRVFSMLLMAAACGAAQSIGEQAMDQRFVALRKWVAQNESKRHDFRYTIHRAVSVASPQGDYPHFHGFTYESRWLGGRDCLSNIVWDDPGGLAPVLDADGCIPRVAMIPIHPARIVETRTPSSITPVSLTNGKAGLRFIFPALPATAGDPHEQNCANAAEFEVLADASTYAFVRTEAVVRTAACEAGPAQPAHNPGEVFGISAGARFVEEYKTYPDDFTTTVHFISTSPQLPGVPRMAYLTTLGRKQVFKEPLRNSVTTAEWELLHLERQTDVQINPRKPQGEHE